MARPGFKQQLNVLVERNIAIQLGSLATLALFLIQPLVIGAFIGIAWENEEPTQRTYFVMAVAAVWMGCMNACCAIVKERAVFDRERMFHLNIWAYLFSHLILLAVICAVQSLLLLMMQARAMNLEKSLWVHLQYFFILTMTGITSASLGLTISAFSKTSYSAAVTVPILLIPQVIFSEVLLGSAIRDRKAPARIEKCTITKWGFVALREVTRDNNTTIRLPGRRSEDEPKWAVMVKSFFMLMAGVPVFLGLAAAKLKWDTS